MTGPTTRLAVHRRATTPVKAAKATARQRGVAHTAEPVRRGDTFKTMTAAGPTAALRPPSSAVTFIKRFEQHLGLRGAVKEQRFKFMSHSYLSFFRANPGLFQTDMRLAYAAPLLGRPAPKVVIGGDTHLGNFGTVRGPSGAPVWTINDFDQATTGSPEIDLMRLATSAVLVGRARGLSAADQKRLATKIGEAYVKALGKEGTPYVSLHDARGQVKDLLQEAEASTRTTLLEKWVGADGRFREQAELERLPAAEVAQATEALAAYGKSLGPASKLERPIRVLDVVKRLNAGGSSLGLDRYYVLVQGKDDRKPRILELKDFPPVEGEGKVDPHAVVSRAQQLTGFKSPLLGAAELKGKKLLVRELEPEKHRVDLEDIGAHALEQVAELAACLLARAHGRGHLRELRTWVGDDGAVLAERLGEMSVRYANQVQADYAAYAHG